MTRGHDAEEDEPPMVVVIEDVDGWNVVEGRHVISRHYDREPAFKAALDWASRQFERGRRLQVVLGDVF